MKKKTSPADLGFDCPFYDDCMNAMEKADRASVTVWLMFSGGFIIGVFLGMAILSAWH